MGYVAILRPEPSRLVSTAPFMTFHRVSCVQNQNLTPLPPIPDLQPSQDVSKFSNEILPAWLKRLNMWVLCIMPLTLGVDGVPGGKHKSCPTRKADISLSPPSLAWP